MQTTPDDINSDLDRYLERHPLTGGCPYDTTTATHNRHRVELRQHHYAADNNPTWSVCCLTCGAESPPENTYQDAIHVFNSRDGRPLPVIDPYAELKTAHARGEVVQYFDDGDTYVWCDCLSPSFHPSLQWRIKPVPVMVPLGPEDVPPGSVFRNVTWKCGSYRIPTQVSPAGVMFFESGAINWHAMRLWQINRSIPLTGRWDANAWEKCEKPEVQP